MVRALALLSLAACGHYGFGGSRDAGGDTITGGPSIDAPTADAALDAPPDAPDAMALPPRFVFMTPATYLGDLNGMGTYSALDTNCTMLANMNGFAGNYAVLLAFVGMNASDHVTLAQGRTIELVDGTQVATDATFFTATHVHAIDLDVTGATQAINNTAWTNFSATGTALANDCAGWTSQLSGSDGEIGSTLAMDATWADSGAAHCNRVAHLLCIGQ